MTKEIIKKTTKEKITKEKLAIILGIISITMLIVSNILTPILNKHPNEKLNIEIWVSKILNK